MSRMSRETHKYGNKKIVFLATVGFAACVVTAALAQTACPDYVSEDNPRVTHMQSDFGYSVRKHLPLTRPITLYSQGRYFRMPIGHQKNWGRFINGSDPDELIGSNCDRSRVGFIFWMPSGRFPERYFANPHVRFCEQGRPPPQDGDYVVSVTMEANTVRPYYTLRSYDTPSMERSPEVMTIPELNYNNFLYRLEKYSSWHREVFPDVNTLANGENIYVVEEVFGMTRLIVSTSSKKDPGWRRWTRREYYQMDDPRYQLYGDCSYLEDPTSKCRFRFWDKKLKFDFSVLIPFQKVSQIHEIRRSTVGLMDRFEKDAAAFGSGNK